MPVGRTYHKGGLCGENTGHLALVLSAALANNRGVVQVAVFWRVVLGLEGTEERLLGTKDLNCRGRVLGQVEE